MAAIAKLGEFVNRKGIYPPLPDADKIQFVEMYDLDSKEVRREEKRIPADLLALVWSTCVCRRKNASGRTVFDDCLEPFPARQPS